ncbi:hypothetical protein D3C85_1673030 [compost metagenome]
MAVIALGDVGVHVQRGGFHQSVEGFGVLVPLEHKQNVVLGFAVGQAGRLEGGH